MIDDAITHIICPGCDFVRELSPAACPECGRCPRCGAKAKAGLPDCGCHLSWDEDAVEGLQEHFGIAAQEVPRERLRFEIRQRLERRKVIVAGISTAVIALVVGIAATCFDVPKRGWPGFIRTGTIVAAMFVVQWIVLRVFRDIEDRLLEEEFDESQ